MKKMISFLYLLCGALLPDHHSRMQFNGIQRKFRYYHRNVWEYDNYYRTGVNHYYNRPEARANVRARAGSRPGGAIRAGGGRR